MDGRRRKCGSLRRRNKKSANRLLVAGNVKNMRKAIQKDIRVETGEIERMMGRGNDQKN